MNASARTTGLGLAVVAVAVGIAACASEPAQKSGARTDRQVTLTLEMPDNGDALGIAFAQAVARRSSGNVRVKLGRGYSNAQPANELRLARALEAGRAEMGYLPARAWSAAGIPAFKALLAPFAVTTDDAAQALATGPVARDVLAALPRTVVGLALVPAESRRVLAVRPPLSPDDFSGLRLRIIDDPQSVATFEALGAQAVQRLAARDATAALERGAIEGVESAPVHILQNGYAAYARHLSGYGVFPKFQSIVVGRAAWERLSTAQRATVRAAAEETVRSASAAVAEQERSNLRQLCDAGTRIAVPTTQQLERLAAATRPTAAAIARDDVAARVLTAMGKLPGAGPQPLASPLPAACTGQAATEEAKPRTTDATFPEGVYVTRVTPAQFRAAGVGQPAATAIVLTTRFRNGRWTQTQKPTFPDQCADVPTPSHPACSGRYRVNGDRLTLVWETPAPPSAPETMKWSYFDGVLRFQPIDVADPGERAVLGQPWRKVR